MGTESNAMTRTAPDHLVPLLGRTLKGADGAPLGEIRQVFVNDETGRPEWISVLSGGREVFVPLARASLVGETIRVPYTVRDLKAAPRVDARGTPRADVDTTALGGFSRLEANTPPSPSVVERGDVVEVQGRTAEDVATGLRLLDAAHDERRAHVDAFGSSLLTAMVSAGLDVAPQPSLAQAKRLATLRATLLADGAYTHATLAKVRGMVKESSVRTWVTRRRDEHALLVVKHEGRSLIPAFQLDDAGSPRPELQPLIAALANAGVTGWEAWSWLCSRSSLLGGEVPEHVARSAPRRALRAAERYVAQLAA